MFIILFLFLALAIGVVFLAKRKLQDLDLQDFSDATSEDIKHYSKKEYIMSLAEFRFFKVLSGAVGNSYIIVPQVSLANLVEVRKGEPLFKKYRSKIDKKTIDFVLFRKDTFTAFLAIELDDSSHQRVERQKRDLFVSSLLESFKIKLVRIPVAYSYDEESVKKQLFEAEEKKGEVLSN